MREREGEAKASIYFSFFCIFGWPMAYIPAAPDSFEATGCPHSRVHILKLLFPNFLPHLRNLFHLRSY